MSGVILKVVNWFRRPKRTLLRSLTKKSLFPCQDDVKILSKTNRFVLLEHVYVVKRIYVKS